MSRRAHPITTIGGILIVALVLALGLGVQSSQAAVSQTIHAFFDAEGNLKFSYLDGSQVAGTIPPGTYQVIYDNFGADDVADDHAFHLFGPGIDFAPAPGVVQATFNVTFQTNGTYTLQDDLHPAIGRRTFVGSNSASSDTSATSSSPGGTASGSSSAPKSSGKATSNDIVGSEIKPFRGTLIGAVGSDGRLTLAFKGKSVASLKSGRYKIAVDDRASKKAFIVQRIKKRPVTVTGLAFVGKRSLTVTLDAGQWWFFSTEAKKNYFIVVS